MEHNEPHSLSIREAASIVKILGEPNRLSILEKIIEGIQCNCDLGSSLQLAPNLVSHHLAVLRDVGLIDTERDPLDARWVYYSINITKLEELRMFFNAFFDPGRVMPRHVTCGPSLAGEQPTKLSAVEQ